MTQPTDTATESSLSLYDTLDTWPLAESLAAIVESNAQAVAAVKRALPQLEQAAIGLERALAAGGRLIYLGAGTSGRLSLQDAAELPPTFGFERALAVQAGGDAASGQALEDAEDNEDEARTRLAALELTQDDAVVGIAASGTTPFTIAGIAYARDRGAFTVGIANNPGAPLLSAAEVGIVLTTPPEVLAGSTRLAAGTAQKVALNALSTAVLVRLGGAYGNLMVGMKPQNAKLRARALRMIMQATGCAEAEAKSALERGGGIREAIVMLLSGCSPAQARARLAQNHNRIRESLDDQL
jgi:N-acetylmuramic acid 6-phosphate etherase